jgi:hypothetical protein
MVAPSWVALTFACRLALKQHDNIPFLQDKIEFDKKNPVHTDKHRSLVLDERMSQRGEQQPTCWQHKCFSQEGQTG